MATRLYLASSGTPGISPAVRADWERSSAAFLRAPISTTKQNTALTTLSAVFGSTSTSQTCYYQGVSDTLDVDQEIVTNVDGYDLIIGKCGETSTNGDAHLALLIRVMADATTERGALTAMEIPLSEFPLIASAATRIQTDRTINTVFALAGDRLVVELGIHGVTPANEIMQMRVGDPTGTADFAFTSGLTTDLVPWVELVQDITFGGAPAPTFYESRKPRAVLQAVKRAASWAHRHDGLLLPERRLWQPAH